jgi:nucleotide-binding universal stress UspA family protein
MAVRPVVVAVDGSEDSLFAVEWAATAASLHDKPLLIAAAPSAPPRIYGVDVPEPVVTNARHGMAARALDAAIRRADAAVPGLAIRTALLSGLPPFAVTAAGEDAMMLVTGARGAGGFAAMVLGSVCRYAAMHAGCPVVVVRATQAAMRREIVVGIQDAEQSSEALAFALEEARSRGAELTPMPRSPSSPRTYLFPEPAVIMTGSGNACGPSSVHRVRSRCVVSRDDCCPTGMTPSSPIWLRRVPYSCPVICCDRDG